MARSSQGRLNPLIYPLPRGAKSAIVSGHMLSPDRSSRQIVVGIAASFLAACTAAVAPSPPLFVELTSGVPSELRLQPLTWPAGRVVVFRAIQHSETFVEGEAPVRKRATSTLTLTGGTGTAEVRRIYVAVDGKQMGSFLNRSGEFTDVSASTPAVEAELRDAVRLLELPVIKRYRSSSFVVGQRSQIQIPTREVLSGDALRAVDRGFMKEMWPATYELVTYRLVSGRQAAEIHWTFLNVLDNALPFPLRLSPTKTVTMRFTSLTGSSRIYVDLATGLSLAEFGNIELSGYIEGKPLLLRWTTLTELDMAKSRL